MYTFAPNRLYCAKMALFIISQDRQTQVFAATAVPVAVTTTIIIDYNS